MAGDEILSSPARLRERAAEVRRHGETFQGVIDGMQALINDLQVEWKGRASEGFAQQFDMLRPSFNDMKQLIDDLGGQLLGSADAIEQLDDDIARKFSR